MSESAEVFRCLGRRPEEREIEMKRDERKKMLEKLEPQLDVFRKAARQNVLQKAWLREMRQALGIPVSELAHRLETSRAGVYRAEQDELQGWITLKTLDEVAHAMECRVVYGLVPYMDQPLDELAQSLKRDPRRNTPQVIARREKKVKKMSDDMQEWRLRGVWERVANQKAAAVRADILARAKSYNWSVEAAEEAAAKEREKPGQVAEGTADVPRAVQEPECPPVPRTAEEMRRMGVGGVEALRAALAETLRATAVGHGGSSPPGIMKMTASTAG
jgi:transcriptional regulator with XRE-family HTH domain